MITLKNSPIMAYSKKGFSLDYKDPRMCLNGSMGNIVNRVFAKIAMPTIRGLYTALYLGDRNCFFAGYRVICDFFGEAKRTKTESKYDSSHDYLFHMFLLRLSVSKQFIYKLFTPWQFICQLLSREVA